MMRLLIALALLPATVWSQAPGLVFKRDKAFPVVSVPLWSDADINILGGTPVVSGLLGYDPSPSNERMAVGYSIGLEFRVTDSTSVIPSAAYLGDVGETRFEHLWDRIGLALLFKIRL